MLPKSFSEGIGSGIRQDCRQRKMTAAFRISVLVKSDYAVFAAQNVFNLQVPNASRIALRATVAANVLNFGPYRDRIWEAL